MRELIIKFSPMKFIINPLNNITENQTTPLSFALHSIAVLSENSAIATGRPNPNEILRSIETTNTSLKENVVVKFEARDPTVPRIIHEKRKSLRLRILPARYAPRKIEAAAPKKLVVQIMQSPWFGRFAIFIICPRTKDVQMSHTYVLTIITRISNKFLLTLTFNFNILLKNIFSLYI